MTEWITLLWIPLIPIGSKRVLGVAPPKLPWWKRDFGSTHYQTTRVPLHMPHVIKGYAATASIVLLIFAADYFKW